MTDDIVEHARKVITWATAGKPVQFHPSYCEEAEGAPFSEWDTSHHLSVIRPDGTRYRIAEFKHADDAAFDQVARTLVPAMADEIERLRAEIAILDNYRTPMRLAAAGNFRRIPRAAPGTITKETPNDRRTGTDQNKPARNVARHGFWSLGNRR